jgi:hypothetical protein
MRLTSRDNEKIETQSSRAEPAPIVEDAKKPYMGPEDLKPRRIGRRILLMPEDPPESRAKKNTMEAMPKRRPKPERSAGELRDQVAADQGLSGDEEPAPGYIRLRLRVDDGDVSVHGVRYVEGPLTKLNEVITPGVSYEAKVGRRRVAVGDVPDPTEWRGFPDPAGRAGLEGHHIIEQTSYEFTVRIPADEIDESSLQDLRVNLFRWRGRGPDDHIDVKELSKEPKEAVSRIATLRGVQMMADAGELREDLRGALAEAAKQSTR